eukprot:SAG11_NODE_32179_length_285_cov_2.268817_1_plen_35_part_10
MYWYYGTGTCTVSSKYTLLVGLWVRIDLSIAIPTR